MPDRPPTTESPPTLSPCAWAHRPALIERLLPVQKLSAEVYKERIASSGQTLTGLGNFWKGRKPLILAKACILGCLLPATDDPQRDLEIFELLMGMDDASLAARTKKKPTPKEIAAKVTLARLQDFFDISPPQLLLRSAPVDWSTPLYANVKLAWRDDVPLWDRRHLEAELLPKVPYRQRIENLYRPEEVADVHDHIWQRVNTHLGTHAHSFPELIEQLGILRFGHRPRVADTFCGSGQIPFEAARLGCDVYASDLNPIACLLTWGAFHIVGGTPEERAQLEQDQQELVAKVQAEIDQLGIEEDGNGWRARNYIYCVEVVCPQTGWLVPLMPSFILSEDYKTVVRLIPDYVNKRYDIDIYSNVSDSELKAAERGTVRSDGRGSNPYLFHVVNGKEYRTKISTLRGDYRKSDRTSGNKLRQWQLEDFMPAENDIFQERLYAVLWCRPKESGKGEEFEFRPVTEEDLNREKIIEDCVAQHLHEWQEKGWIPDMAIESGDKTDEPIRTRGWTYWHHLFTARQLFLGALLRENTSAYTALGVCQAINYNSRLCRWLGRKTRGAGNNVQTFDNQALNTLYNYGTRGFVGLKGLITQQYSESPLPNFINLSLACHEAKATNTSNDIYITDPPYGDAVKYEEITEFFIAWLRKNPPPEFADWLWDSRRALAIKGEGEEFRRNMVESYRRMTECMADNGLQVIMFTHQSGAIWADMANIVWAAGLQVTAAWYVVTETDSGLRSGSYVKGTVLLVCRKRQGHLSTTRDDLAWDLQEEVEQQVNLLTGLNQQARGWYRDENVFEDADLQMAGYAAALRVLTQYDRIDGRDMTNEALRPRIKGETTFVDELIAFAVDIANQHLVPSGLSRDLWKELQPTERFYLKMLDLELRGLKTLDNYQNFAKAFKVRDFYPLMADKRANHVRLKSAIELGSSLMDSGSEFGGTLVRGILYALMELQQDEDVDVVIQHLSHNLPDFYRQREQVIEVCQYIEHHLRYHRAAEASAARILAEALLHQRLN
ncbi:anti-phage-associated DUF1156 domain-containing protein [Thermosynechococcus sp. GLH187]|uniref:anti-phage-associated DUF1156 domain-containing protein n=1 Tax=unclassified Thermosynechococcus TaxID=2622553 RepID=UPI002673475D|nr:MULTISPECIES: anti-phage-associated DUF1156 domain-containing protein [unclassified Thermosynechococcus]MDR5639461.1 DUF1156 domain-containing protein [Thermosynechococcus sp. PP42]WKT82422.1 DUF1156 domain-containing protein [Thermosynechococcus sp. PP45]WNC26039.1 anti-phage-associated DUF1156 domain-containing protein [Thermosynechococcus sp. PP551]WNC28619.1 anti-phage-associated DUF1156 domain-containing protein [Thermosynechococcus sp. PP555]WNC46335.1 anti-phage-associated DUF1156 do